MSLEELWFKKSKIFRDESKLQVDYVPKVLPHRKDQLMQLGQYFKPFIVSPGSLTVKVILVGGVGTGKTAVAKSFGRKVEEFTSAREGARVRYSHVNCYIHRTFFSIMQRVASDLGISVPRRGFSSKPGPPSFRGYLALVGRPTGSWSSSLRTPARSLPRRR